MTFAWKFIRSFTAISTLEFMLMSAAHTSNQIFESDIWSFCLENARLSGGEVLYFFQNLLQTLLSGQIPYIILIVQGSSSD